MLFGLLQMQSENEGIPPSKYANAELMKIPNFLHLTPNHIKKHCQALKGNKDTIKCIQNICNF